MRRLNESEAGALIELLTLALERRDPVQLVEAAQVAWGRGSLGNAADRCAVALKRGEPLSQALEGCLPSSALAALVAGEMRDDPVGGLARATAALERGARSRRRVLVPAAYPLTVLSVAGLAGAVLALLAAPSIQSLRVELAALAGRPEPGGFVAVAAAHPNLVAALGGFLAILPLLLPLAFASLPRTRLGCAFMLRLPWVGRALRWRACADLLESLGDLIAGGVAHDEAWELACAAVGPCVPRARLQEQGAAAAAGEPLGDLLAAAGLPAAASRALDPLRLRHDGGVAVLHETAAEADAAHERLLVFGGRALALTAGATGVAAAGGLLAAVLLPLFQTGGVG